MKSVNTLRCLAVAATLLCASASSHASLIYAGSLQNTGSGFGNVNTVLTLNGSGNTATGSVIRSGGADVTTGDATSAGVQNATFSFSQLNITNANQIRLIFNASEPGNVNNSINLDAMTLSIYSDIGGAALFSTSLAAGQFFATTENGIGSIGYAFILDAASTALAQSFVTGTNRIGLASSISLATGGPDTFLISIAAGPQGPGNSIPEPGSLLLLGLGLAGITASGLRKRAKQ
ncbi:MAG TPA: PEP-CTERM sorting domain-containing protein [Telluria sp.]